MCQAYRRVLVCSSDRSISDLFSHLFSDCWSVLDGVSEWFPFAPSLLAILARLAELRSHSSCNTLFSFDLETLVECFGNSVCFH